MARLLVQDTGLRLPAGEPFAWWRDAHLLAALAAAVPVWALLATAVGVKMHAPGSVPAWLGFTLLRPGLEELVFRGLLQGQMLRLLGWRRIGPLTFANGATTAVFVAAHFMSQPPGWALAVSVPSLVLGHLRERLGSVWPAVAVHMIYNLGFGLVAWGLHR